MKNKRKARVLALQVMYAYDVRDDIDISILFNSITEHKKIGKESLDYAERLVHKTANECENIDKLLQKHASNWEVKRMAVIDRNVLRLAIAELDYSEKVPFKVVIDEAVEIAKIYGTDESGKFVNGIIDAIHKKMAGDT